MSEDAFDIALRHLNEKTGQEFLAIIGQKALIAVSSDILDESTYPVRLSLSLLQWNSLKHRLSDEGAV